LLEVGAVVVVTAMIFSCISEVEPGIVLAVPWSSKWVLDDNIVRDSDMVSVISAGGMEEEGAMSCFVSPNRARAVLADKTVDDNERSFSILWPCVDDATIVFVSATSEDCILP
jgi:hypothetical protein